MLHFWQEDYLGDIKKWCIDLTLWAIELWGDGIVQSVIYQPGTTEDFSKDSIERMAKVLEEKLLESKNCYKNFGIDETVIITFVNGKKIYIDCDYNGFCLSN